MSVVSGRITRKPYYGIDEACRRWEISAIDLAGFVIEREIVLSVVVATLPVDVGTIEDMGNGDWFRIPEGRRHVTGAMDLLPIDAWRILTVGSQVVRSFRAEGDGYIDIAERGDNAGEIVVAREQLIVRHAELTRFEAAQEEIVPPVSRPAVAVTPPAAVRGAPPKYDWDEFYCELVVSTQIDGFPESQAAMVRRMVEWFATRNLYPDQSTIKKKVALLWRRYHEALARLPA
ncbi:hypothetical protein [Roseococcus thiosulfatophilus]|uniref:hypothetical protein n=1 Tax=Roseococcus thiosulfatophilus TaxID=35813 RepID=UPI001A8C9B75|nr:hypothetical protein [Roseococcus thiosulfatophilus]